jgi:hypothetical protein
MGVSYDYFSAADDDAARRPEAPGVGVPTKWVDPQVRLGRLSAQARGVPWSLDECRGTRVLPVEAPGPEDWDVPTVERLPDGARDALAGVADADRPEIARWWATTEEFVRDGADRATVEVLALDLLALARDARETGAHLYVGTSW